MGNTSMKVKTILFLCLATTVAIWAVTEVQELGNNDAHDDSHESANLDAGDDHVDADDDDSIGEDMGVGRRWLPVDDWFLPAVLGWRASWLPDWHAELWWRGARRGRRSWRRHGRRTPGWLPVDDW